MFEVGGQYANRKGQYTILSIDGPTMSVRYEDGTEANLNANIQARIWENIVAEQELKNKRATARTKKKTPSSAHHFVKVVNVLPGEELAFPGWEERVVMAPSEEIAQQIKKGDRLIYFSKEAMTFFAVATITGDPTTANPKKYSFSIPENEATFFQIDIDTDTGRLDRGVTWDSIELESCPDLSAITVAAENFCPISEDDFELLSEVLTEISEVEDESDDMDDDDDFDEDDE